MTEEAYGRLGRRLRRILLMLPYAIKHPGVSVDELSRKFGVEKRDLLEDLNLVYMCGLPGYGPGDLIDVSFEDDRVYVRMADYFSAPLRLSPAEALSLYAGGAALASLPDMTDADALRSALEKLGRALGADGDRSADVTVHLEEGASEHLGVIQEALRKGKRIHLEYLSASRGVLTERDVDPWGLIAALGYWYIVGLDHDSGEERMFRTDRIKAVALDLQGCTGTGGLRTGALPGCLRRQARRSGASRDGDLARCDAVVRGLLPSDLEEEGRRGMAACGAPDGR